MIYAADAHRSSSQQHAAELWGGNKGSFSSESTFPLSIASNQRGMWIEDRGSPGGSTEALHTLRTRSKLGEAGDEAIESI
jgi:hypothetical protein